MTFTLKQQSYKKSLTATRISLHLPEIVNNNNFLILEGGK